MIKNVRSLRISLCRWVALVALVVCPVVVQAFPASINYGPYGNAYYGGEWPTAAASCAEVQTRQAHLGVTTSLTLLSRTAAEETWRCDVMNPTVGNGYFIISGTAGAASCPSTATLSAGQCTCRSGYIESGNACVQSDVVDLLNKSGAPLVGDGPCPSGLSSCFQGKTVRGSGGTCWKDKVTGKPAYELYGPFTDLKTPCTVAATEGGGSAVSEPTTPSPADCSGYWGQVNGVDRCIPKSGSSGTGTVEKGDSTTTTTGTGGTTTAEDQKTTVCQDGTCTTTGTKTVTNPDGTTTTTSTTTQQQQTDYCSANPAAAACKTQEWCESHPETVGCSEFGTPDDSVKLSKSDFGFSQITEVAFAKSASCPGDVSFTAMGKSYAFSYGSMCGTAANYVAPVVLVLGAALAAFVFVGGFRS